MLKPDDAGRDCGHPRQMPKAWIVASGVDNQNSVSQTLVLTESSDIQAWMRDAESIFVCENSQDIDDL